MLVVHTGRVIKLAPPLGISEEALIEGIRVLDDCIKKFYMIKEIRHTGIVVENLKVMTEFYGFLGFTSQSQASEHGPFIEQITGLKDVNLRWIKMYAPDGSVLELLKYEWPNEIEKNRTTI